MLARGTGGLHRAFAAFAFYDQGRWSCATVLAAASFAAVAAGSPEPLERAATRKGTTAAVATLLRPALILDIFPFFLLLRRLSSAFFV
jgi:hypothetical protein